jgi:type I restriction enzyme R subunit
VDRIALRDQTLDAFKEHLPNEPRWPKQGEKEIAKDRRIYVFYLSYNVECNSQ